MPLTRLGRTVPDQVELTGRTMKRLPWADDAQLASMRRQQPSAERLESVDLFKATPPEYLAEPLMRARMLENELSKMLHTWMAAVSQHVDPAKAEEIAYTAGRAHGRRRLSTFLKAIGSNGGAEAMARWQDTAHASAGLRHSTALFARFDAELVEVVRTEDSFGMHTGQESPSARAFMDGLVDGYQDADPALRAVEEIVEVKPTGDLKFIHRFWYRVPPRTRDTQQADQMVDAESAPR